MSPVRTTRSIGSCCCTSASAARRLAQTSWPRAVPPICAVRCRSVSWTIRGTTAAVLAGRTSLGQTAPSRATHRPFHSRAADSPEIVAHAAAIWRQSDDLRRAFHGMDDERFWQWLVVHGPREYPDWLAHAVPPLPPAPLLGVSSGGP